MQQYDYHQASSQMSRIGFPLAKLSLVTGCCDVYADYSEKYLNHDLYYAL